MIFVDFGSSEDHLNVGLVETNLSKEKRYVKLSSCGMSRLKLLSVIEFCKFLKSPIQV